MTGDSIWASTSTTNVYYNGWMLDTLLLLSPGKSTLRVLDATTPCPHWQNGTTTCDVSSVQVDGTAAVFARGTQVVRDSFLTVVSGSVLWGRQVVDSLPLADGLTYGEITGFALRHDSLWMGSQYPAAFRTGLFLPGHLPRMFQPTLRGTRIVGQIARPGGQLWIATDSALYRRSDASSAFSDLLDATGCAFTALAVVGDTLWLSSTDGLHSWPGGRTIVSGNSIEDLAASAKLAYLRTSSGAIYCTGSEFSLHLLTGAQEVYAPVPSDSGTTSQMASFLGFLWVGTSTALTSIGNGMPSNEIRTGYVVGLDATDTCIWTSLKYGVDSYLLRLRQGNIPGGEVLDSFYHASGQIGAVLAASDTSAWTFSNFVPGAGIGAVPPVPATLCRWNLRGLVGTCLASGTSPLRPAMAADNRRPLLADSSGGLWMVQADGIQRWANAGLPVGAGLAQRSSRTPAPMRLSGNVLSFSLSSGGRALLEIIDLSGRILDRQDLGVLAAGPHAVKIPQGNGVRLCRVAAGSDRQSLEIAGF
jgi:hypothetical protein